MGQPVTEVIVTKTKAQQYQEGERKSVQFGPVWTADIIGGKQQTDRTKLIEHAVYLDAGVRKELEGKSTAELNEIVAAALRANAK